MSHPPRSAPPPSSVLPLPQGFTAIEEIQNMPNDQIRAGPLVSIIGFVTDYQRPVRTKGTDYKCTIEVKDPSVQYESRGLKIIIFWDEAKMPRISGVRDALLVRRVKVQMWNKAISLLSNHSSEFHVLPALKIPRGPNEVPRAEWQLTPSKSSAPRTEETTYVALASLNIGGMSLPSSQEFEARVAQSMNVKDKFSLLKDVESNNFYNLLGQVIKIFDGSSSRMTVYLSDYTANSSFYEYVWNENSHTSDDRDRDEYGNKASKPRAGKDWPGPFGRLAIQLTLYDAHADFVRDNVEVDEWIFLRNVQIKFGNMGGCLEGFLRGNQNQYESAVRVEVMKQREERGGNEVRLKDATRRKYLWWKKFNQQKQAFLDDAACLGDKRKRDKEPVKMNSKRRRHERRAAVELKNSAVNGEIAQKLDLNENIRCSHPDLPTLPIPSILKPRTTKLDDGSNREIALPFVVGNFKANVRVVGYFPPEVADFAIGRRVSEYDVLSDYSGGEDTDSEEFKRSWKSGKGAPEKVWEWRFALQVEDASSKAGKERMWLLVDNAAAQGLLDMDAANLRSREGKETLRELKERLCILWGDLEEYISASRSSASLSKSISPGENEISSSPVECVAGDQPNVDSDDEDDSSLMRASRQSQKPSALQERDLNIRTDGNLIETADPSKDQPTIHNKAFTCCIKQYGIKVKEADVTMANAGDGKRWERKFGLFGVVIT